MNDAAFVGIMIAIGLLLGAGFIGLAFWLKHQRRKRMMEWAASNGYTFEESQHDLAKEFEGFSPFNQGHSRRAWHVIHGTRHKASFTAFQYEFTTGGGKNQQHHAYHIAAIRMPMRAPNLTLRKEGLHHKLFDAIGGEDIDFESDAFSREWWVRCDDRKFAYDIIHARMMEFLGPHIHYVWQWRGDTLMVSRVGRIEPDKAQGMLDALLGFLEQVPDHVR